jgi:hypothetical protein
MAGEWPQSLDYAGCRRYWDWRKKMTSKNVGRFWLDSLRFKQSGNSKDGSHSLVPKINSTGTTSLLKADVLGDNFPASYKRLDTTGGLYEDNVTVQHGHAARGWASPDITVMMLLSPFPSSSQANCTAEVGFMLKVTDEIVRSVSWWTAV